MKPALKIGLLFCFLFIGIKLLCFFLNVSLNEIKPFVLINMFLITLAITIAIYTDKTKHQGSNFLDDVKTGMTCGLPYSILVSVFLFFYYHNIYPDYTDNKIEYVKDELKKTEKIEEIRSSNDALSNKSDNEIRKQMIENTEAMYSPKFTLVISLLGLTIFSTLNSIIISLIMRKIVFRNQ